MAFLPDRYFAGMLIDRRRPRQYSRSREKESAAMKLARPIIVLVSTASFAALAGCADSYVPKEQPSFYRDLSIPGNELDAAAAASMISGYRANNHLPPVRLDPALMQMAQAQAELMARRDKLDHDAGKPFVTRLKSSGYDAKAAAENISAGYHTLAEAFSGWRDSAPHRANMLLNGATRIGIAAVYTPASKYKVYWTLILAEPDKEKG
jgi:uncharacterized protein YkwD